MLSVEDTLRTNAAMLIRGLVDGSYDLVAAVTRNSRLTEAEIRTAVESYGGTLVTPPGDGVPPDLSWKIIDDEPRRVFATMSLWTVEEGESDLSLEMQMIELRPGLWLNELYDIRVL